MATAAVPPTPPATAALREGAYREVGVVHHASVRAERYRLRGAGKIYGDVDVGELEVEGTLSIGGRLIADQVDLRGTIDIAGDARIATTAAMEGTIRIDGSAAATDLRSKGFLRVGGALTVEDTLATTGSFEVSGEARAGFFQPDGLVGIGGNLTARTIDGRFDGQSRIGGIVAATVRLTPRQLLRLPVDLPFLRPHAALTVERLEADRVEIEGVTVRYLRSPAIRLGRHCHVTTLEGNLLRRDPSSHVGYESRSPPPPGLMR